MQTKAAGNVGRIQMLLVGRDRPESGVGNHVLDFGEIRVDQDKHEVMVRGESLHFTKKEFELLVCLAENEGRVMRSSDLLKRVWDYDDSIRSRTLDVHIGRVRAKIERRPGQPEIIVTVPCIGYKFISPQSAA